MYLQVSLNSPVLAGEWLDPRDHRARREEWKRNQVSTSFFVSQGISELLGDKPW